MARRWTALAVGVALAALAAPAYAAGGDALTSNWAKVNVCSSSQLGARAQLAGDGSRDRMEVRFTAEWLSPDGWVPLAGQPTSPWQDAGSAVYTWSQAGWNFDLTIPATGEAYQLRAVAEMKLGSGRGASYTTGTCSVGG
ncbi:MAG: hypothetical protein QOE69_1260 [Thermoleophilaceae bacterium]|nr:hypothetical protein [Thermoleophilaceae bacterium]MEA2407141.1 hypothetical protein [Thermoleophilaceae bacterium]